MPGYFHLFSGGDVDALSWLDGIELECPESFDSDVFPFCEGGCYCSGIFPQKVLARLFAEAGAQRKKSRKFWK